MGMLQGKIRSRVVWLNYAPMRKAYLTKQSPLICALLGNLNNPKSALHDLSLGIQYKSLNSLGNARIEGVTR